MIRTLALDIPIAPPLNGLYRNVFGKGRVKTVGYKRWIESCGSHFWRQKPAGGFPYFDGPFDIMILVPLKMRGDVDGRAKAVLDTLKKPWSIIADDSLAMSCAINRNPDIAPGMCRVILRDVSPPPLARAA